MTLFIVNSGALTFENVSGLYTFVMVLFLFQGTAAILGANYQMPHEFALCRSRLVQAYF